MTYKLTKRGRLFASVKCVDCGTTHDERPAHVGGRGLVKVCIDGRPRCVVCEAQDALRRVA